MTSPAGSSTECIVLVLLEMGLSFSGIVCNLLIVTTLRQEESLQASTLNFLLFNLCFSNLIISFLVKPISAIYIGYAVSTGESQVGLAFCTLYTFTYRTTWCVFPFTLIAMCWCKLFSQCLCSRCGIVCCKRKKALANKLPKMMRTNSTVPVTVTETPQPVTELLAFRPPRLSVNNSASILRGDSMGSTPSPSTTPEVQQQQPQSDEMDSVLQLPPPRPLRTLSDGPTARQKLLVCAIWLASALFGFLTCFPEKMIGATLSKQFNSYHPEETTTVATVHDDTSVSSHSVDLSYCTIKTGVNDMLDYIALIVALVAPFVIGPCVVGVFQGIFAVFGRFVCSSGQSRAGDGRSNDFKEDSGPGWPIIVAFTIVFLTTYPLHMYIAELYLQNDFAFLLAKYCIGFLYVICIPVITIVVQKEIRMGISSVLGNAVNCVEDIDDLDPNQESQ